MLTLLAGAHASASEGLTSLPQSRPFEVQTSEVTWMAHDVSPDGRTIVFDVLGEIHRMDIGGGDATPLLSGLAHETSPVFSPDGTQLAFLSDRSGSNNVWVARSDGSQPRQLSFDTGVEFFASPAWSADGTSVYASRTMPPLLAFELFRYDLSGGKPVKVVSAQPAGHESFDSRRNALGVAVSPQGRYLYYASKRGTTWSDKVNPDTWSIMRHDLKTGDDAGFIQLPGGAMKPVLSRDGRKLVYASRSEGRTGLRIRDLETSEDRWLSWPLDPDGQEGGYYADLLPGYRFLPDGSAVLVAVGGGLQTIALDGTRTPLPFSTRVALEIGPDLHIESSEETGPVRARLLQSPALSPDGQQLAFTAFGALYVHDLERGTAPRKLETSGVHAWHPAWSPDGAMIAYVTWSPREGGQVWTVAADGTQPPGQRTQVAAYYSEPMFLPVGTGHGQGDLVVLRASHHARVSAPTEFAPSLPTDLVRIAADGAQTRLGEVAGARALQYDRARGRLQVYSGQAVVSIPLAGGEPDPLLAVRQRSPSQYVGVPVPVAEVRLHPDGRRALARAASQLFLVDVPAPAKPGATPDVDLTRPGPGWTTLTRVGADAFAWIDGGKAIAWMVGSTYHRVALADVERGAAAGSAEAKARAQQLSVEMPRDQPAGALLLRGGNAITMRGDEVIRRADVLVVGNRIAAIGTRGSFPLPDGVEIRDVSGRWLLPGFIDTHAHWFGIRRSVLDPEPWEFLANLAYGVTSGLDVQSFTADVFAYQDLLDAGLMVGPRAYSTGPGVFVDSGIDSADDARAVLARYRDHYRTRNVKAYMMGNRAQRRAFIEAAHAMGMLPTTEGASDARLNLSHAVDGFAGNEHTLPVSPLRTDVIALLAGSGISYTPTLQVLYGGRQALDAMIIAHLPQDDPKVRRFIPGDVVQAKTEYRRWSRPQDQDYPRFARDVTAVQRAGGRIGVGSHGEMQGVGYHWELEAHASGGATPHEVLRAATLGSSGVIGRAGELGSLEAGKLADLLVLTRDPLADIRNSQAIESVMKNGRLYDAGSLDETWPRQRSLPRPWFRDAGPQGTAVARP
ncbi:amidohydrolase family protein [Luteimonas sp. RIT-PG2_3]